jgi:hypothetical protein
VVRVSARLDLGRMKYKFESSFHFFALFVHIFLIIINLLDVYVYLNRSAAVVSLWRCYATKATRIYCHDSGLCAPTECISPRVLFVCSHRVHIATCLVCVLPPSACDSRDKSETSAPCTSRRPHTHIQAVDVYRGVPVTPRRRRRLGFSSLHLCAVCSRTSHLAPRTSHLAPRTSHLAPRTSHLARRFWLSRGRRHGILSPSTEQMRVLSI